MNSQLLIASILVVALGVVHSILGEKLVFAAMGAGMDGHPLGRRRIRALWSTWHLLSLFGFAMAGVLLYAAGRDDADAVRPLLRILLGTFGAAAVFWGAGTRLKHPAWAVFAVIAALIALSGKV